MKKIIVIICLIAMMGYGWYSYAQTFLEKNEEKSHAEELIAKADGYVEKKLYQRAIYDYTEAIETLNSEDNWKKLINAYQKRYEEDNSILSDYISTLKSAVINFPTNRDFVVKLYDFFIDEKNYESAYKYLNYAEENGLTDDELKNKKLSARYIYYDYNLGCDEYIGLVNNAYTARIGDKWGAYNTAGSTKIDFKYEYLSRGGYNNTRIYTTNKDSRLINEKGVVMGIFPFKVTEAGVYSQGYVAVKQNDKYTFYNSFAEKAFGDYDYAGCFVNNKAAVKSGDKWFLVNEEGETVSDEFTDIKLAPTGSYISGDVIIAKDSNQKYSMYDSDFNKIGNLECEDMDYAADATLIAFKNNGKWGYADKEGNIVIEPEYDNAKSFSNGLGAVCKNGKWGFINDKKEQAIDYTFIEADYFNSDGSCVVRKFNEGTDNDEKDKEKIWSIITLELGV
ncbi:MAG: WG repeat-containing protein [Candidatus Pseudoruminococcus sp.]|nr:WG repeat-containing protein [Ruminococcus sp.]MDY2782879.1 WG repeat-containing protein [Candidatus Pseudoruminococcus sp.]